MRRREFLGSTAAAGALAAQTRRTQTPRPQTPPPNVLLIISDDQGYGDLGCHGNPHLKTPNLDRLAAEGVQFTQFHSSPVCAPTRASLMTGRYNYRTGAIDTYLGRAMMYPDEVTAAEMFRAGGYRTGLFGKWHLGDNYPMRPIDQGFEQALHHLGGGLGQPSDHPGSSYFDPWLQRNGKWEKTKGYCTDVFADAAIDFIRKGGPWFCYLATNAPHSPLEIEDRYVAPYRGLGLDETTAKVYGMVANLDENLGRVFQAIEASGQKDNTIVIFMTDNGPQQRRYNAGMRGQKGTVYEGGIRVPFFLRWPAGAKGGRKIDRLAAHIDVLPTLLDACGVRKTGSNAFDGRSLMPLLKDERAPWADRTLFFQWHRGDAPEPFRACAARNQRWKLVNGKELYDLQNDPAESADVAEKYPDVAARLRSEYEAWFKDVSATRGYDPPRIQLGTPHENPVTLTRQDWRGPRAGWDKGSIGYWECEVMRAGNYEVTLRFPKAAAAGEAHLRIGEVEAKRAFDAGSETCVFENVALTRGKARVEPVLKAAGGELGVHYVDVTLR